MRLCLCAREGARTNNLHNILDRLFVDVSTQVDIHVEGILCRTRLHKKFPWHQSSEYIPAIRQTTADSARVQQHTAHLDSVWIPPYFPLSPARALPHTNTCFGRTLSHCLSRARARPHTQTHAMNNMRTRLTYANNVAVALLWLVPSLFLLRQHVTLSHAVKDDRTPRAKLGGCGGGVNHFAARGTERADLTASARQCPGHCMHGRQLGET